MCGGYTILPCLRRGKTRNFALIAEPHKVRVRFPRRGCERLPAYYRAMDRYTDADSIRRRFEFALPLGSAKVEMLCLFAYDFCLLYLSYFPVQSAAKSARRQCGSPRRVLANAGASVQNEAAHTRQEQDTRKIPPCFCSRLPVFAIDFRAETKPAAGYGCGKIPFGRAALSRAAGTDGRATMGICGRSAAVRFRFAAAQPDLLRPQDKKCRRAKKQTHFLTNIHK